MTHTPSGSGPSRGGPRPALAHLEKALEDLAARGLLRQGAPPAGATGFITNDYLGFARQPIHALARGAGASRLVHEQDLHRELERALARWLDLEACLLFSSGWAANVGTLAALVQPDDVVVSDALNHASLIDGIRLSRAEVVITPHNDVGAVARALAAHAPRRRWVVVESYYSMDADGPDLRALRQITHDQDAALYVDEAHALGVLGAGGRGLCKEAGITPDVFVGTLGKAFGSQGAFVGGARDLRSWLWNRARSFVFSTGLAPAAVVAAKTALDALIANPTIGREVLARADRFREALQRGGPSVEVLGFGHIVPLVAGSAERAVALSKHLQAAGVHVPPIRPPTVPDGTARLRITITAEHTDDVVLRFARLLLDVLDRP